MDGPTKRPVRQWFPWVMARRFRPAIGEVLIGGALAAGATALLFAHGAPFVPRVPLQAQSQPLSAVRPDSNPIEAVYQRVAPSVVLVTNHTVTTDLFYGPMQTTGYGSGVIFSRDGYIVTNAHVVSGYQNLTVTLANGREYSARLIGESTATDLAVIQINAKEALTAATFANSDDVVPGQVAIAIGNPLGPQFAGSVTAGIVSALRPMLYPPNAGDQRVTEMIQTDAAINPGNSGGPLLNTAGQVIGINSMKITRAEASVAASGLGFAIPSNTVQRVASEIVRYGYVREAYLGVNIAVKPERALPTQRQTVTVAAVHAGGPAAKAGVQPGDVIMAWSGRPVLNYYQLVLALNEAEPGQTVRLTVARSGGTIQVPLVLGEAPHTQASVP